MFSFLEYSRTKQNYEDYLFSKKFDLNDLRINKIHFFNPKYHDNIFIIYLEIVIVVPNPKNIRKSWKSSTHRSL